jgi:hypothetical protein
MQTHSRDIGVSVHLDGGTGMTGEEGKATKGPEETSGADRHVSILNVQYCCRVPTANLIKLRTLNERTVLLQGTHGKPY